MNERSESNALWNWMGQRLFPSQAPGRQQRELRAFLLSLALGMTFCFGFAYILTTLSLQGRL